MKKTIAIMFVVLLASMLVFSACGGNNNNDNPVNTEDVIFPVSISQLWDKVKAVSGFGEMTAVPRRDYMDIYGIDDTKLEEAVWYMSENPSLNADEVAIFKLNDASYAGTLAKLLNDRLARQLEVAKTYSPDEASKLEKATVVTEGSWVYYCVGDASEAMMNVIKTTNK